MSFGKVIGTLQIIAGLFFVLAHFKIVFINEIMGYSSFVVFATISLLLVIVSLMHKISLGKNRTMEIIVHLFFALLPLIYIFNEFLFKIIEELPIAEKYFLIMGIVAIISGIMSLF